MSAKRVPRKKTVTKYSEHYRRAEGMTQTTISLEKALLDEIKEAAADDDRSVSNFIVATMRRELKKRRKR